MYRVAEIRRTRISGRMDNHERKVGKHWVVTLQGEEFPVKIKADKKGSTVKFDDGTKMRVSSDWTPGRQPGHAGCGRIAAGSEGRQDHLGLPYALARC